MDSKILELVKKIKALADRGVGGEKENAQATLARLMEKYNLSETDIENEKKIRCEFRYKNEIEERLIWQIIGSVTLSKGYSAPTDTRRKVFWKNLTASEKIEIELKWSIYKKLWSEELEVFYHAFVVQNNIFNPSIAPKQDLPETPEERAKLRRIYEMAESVKKAEIHKQLKQA